MKHLWDIEHPYHCAEENRFAETSKVAKHYCSWEDFFKVEGDADPDLNLVFRFDWYPAWEERDEILKICFINQRIGVYRWATVAVCHEDEPAVKEWLKTRWERMKMIWEPFSNEGET